MRTLRCLAEKRHGRWEALCIDLDIAVDAPTLAEARASLDEAVRLYVDSLSDLAPADRARLLRRSAPLKYLLRYWIVRLTHRNMGEHAGFTVPCAA